MDGHCQNAAAEDEITDRWEEALASERLEDEKYIALTPARPHV
jgi:hypothetical protein